MIFDGEVEPCINGRTVALGAYFGDLGLDIGHQRIGLRGFAYRLPDGARQLLPGNPVVDVLLGLGHGAGVLAVGGHARIAAAWRLEPVVTAAHFEPGRDCRRRSAVAAGPTWT